MGKVDINIVLVAKDTNAIQLNSNTSNEFDKYDGMLYFFVLYINPIVEDVSNNKVYNFDIENNNYANQDLIVELFLIFDTICKSTLFLVISLLILELVYKSNKVFY